MEKNTEMKEYHYIISYNPEIKEWVHEFDVEYVKFDGKSIWNSDTDEWESLYKEDTEWEKEIDEIDSLLLEGLDYLNRNSIDRENNDESK